MHCVWHSACMLGESPLWHPTQKMLYWVDIVEKKLHCFHPQSKQHHEWLMQTNICCLGIKNDDEFIVGMRDGIALFDSHKNQLHYLAKFPENQLENSMSNDGHCDRQGRFWIGTKDITESNPNSGIFRFSDNKLIQLADQFIITNGLITSIDSKYFYIADSPKRIIYRYDFDKDSGELSNRIVFATIPEDGGYPDGMTIDSEGYLWNCHFNGWRVTRYDPDGHIDRVIKMPVSAPTSCCFGGDDLKTLFITSAKRDVTESELKNQPFAGGLFAINVDIAGVEEPFFKES